MFDELGIVLRRIFQTNFQRQTNEKILFITDAITPEQFHLISSRKKELIQNRAKFVELLSIRTRDLYGADEVSLISYPSTLKHGTNPPNYVIEEIKKNQIFFALTSYSITYTDAIQSVLQFGVRGATMPLATPEMFKEESPICADSNKIQNLGDKIIKKVHLKKEHDSNKKCTVMIEDENGSSFSFNILENDQHFFRNYGKYHHPGSYGNLPAGEIYTVPDINATASGKLIIPKNNTKYCEDDECYLELTFEKGKIKKITGAKDVLNQYLGFSKGPKYPKDQDILKSRRNFALFGIGLNEMVKQDSSILESSKKLGACHIGLGSSSGFGGLIKSDFHFGFVLSNSNIFINGNKIVDKGNIKIE